MSGPWSGLKPYAISLLRHDQKRIRRMLRDLDRLDTVGERNRLLDLVESELAVYSRVCHEVLYPAIHKDAKRAPDFAAYHEVRELHRAVELHLIDLRRGRPESPQFVGRARALRLACADLFRVQDDELFPAARRIVGRHGLKSLGRAMQDHRRAVLLDPALPPRA